MTDTVPAARRRNAGATRLAILDAARRRFAELSYENAGLRDIARDAGVDVALVNRYFGSKEELFREVLRADERDQPLFENIAAADLPDYLASIAMKDRGDQSADLDRFLIILRSASSPQAKAIVSQAIDEAIIAPVSTRLGGETAHLQASMALMVLMGSGIMRKVMRQTTICELDKEVLRARLRSLFKEALRAE